MAPDPAPAGSGGRRRVLAAAAAVLLALTALVLLGRAAIGQHTAAQPAAGADSTTTRPITSTMATTSQRPTGSASGNPFLSRSEPRRLDIPAIDAHASVMALGLRRDGGAEVPPLEEKRSRAGWYENSPTPGQLGPAIILGHIDSDEHGPAVFFELGQLQTGDTVKITREDGTVAWFRIDRVAEYPKNRFPTEEVYGATDHASLRLITCGGRFDPAKGSYEKNIVAYATFSNTKGR